jgi:hopanoid biosynthesis associated protein HpnK
MRLLVVNADDFGLTESVNRGILEAHTRGILTSTTILANGAAFDSAVALARQAPGLGVGVHLNLTEGRPVASPSEVSSLLNEHGRFLRSPAALVKRVLTGRLRADEIERELSAQIEKVQRAGIGVTHLDGHKHVHMLPGILPVVLRVAQRYGISAMRWAAEHTPGVLSLLRRNPGAAQKILGQRLRARVLAAAAMGYRGRVRAAGVACPMYFFGVVQTGFLDAAALAEILWNLPEGSSELMCHPGYADAALAATGTRLVATRQRELEALTSPAIRKLIAELGIKLVNYRAVLPAR